MPGIRTQFALLKRILITCGRLIYRIGTQRMRVLPDFYVIGPPRSGTSSIYHYLGQHPCYVRPYMKELAYSVDSERTRAPHGIFNQEIYRHAPAALRGLLTWTIQGLYFQNGADGYRKLFPLASKMRTTARRHGGAVTGEFTVFGLYDAATIRGFPFCLAGDGTRFITILRNPVDFLYSFYTMEIRSQFRQTRPEISFEQFLHRPEDLYVDDKVIRRWETKLQQWRPHFEQYPFFDESRYSFATFMVSYVVFIRHWMHQLPPDRFLVLGFSDLCERSRDTMGMVFDFLGLPAFDIPEVKPVNANTYSEQIPPQAASYIKELTRPYDEELYELLGRDLGWAKSDGRHDPAVES